MLERSKILENILATGPMIVPIVVKVRNGSYVDITQSVWCSALVCSLTASSSL